MLIEIVQFNLGRYIDLCAEWLAVRVRDDGLRRRHRAGRLA